MASTLPDDSDPSARLVPPRAQAAPAHPRALHEHLGSLRWPQKPTSGRPEVEDFALSTTRYTNLEPNGGGWRGSTMDPFSYPLSGGQDPQEYEDKFGLPLQVYRIFRG